METPKVCKYCKRELDESNIHIQDNLYMCKNCAVKYNEFLAITKNRKKPS